jgi:hypothetical protein
MSMFIYVIAHMWMWYRERREDMDIRDIEVEAAGGCILARLFLEGLNYMEWCICLR